MKYIALAINNNELIVINDMDAFATHFCYSKKQRHGKIDIPAPVTENTDDDVETPIPRFETEEAEITDEDEL